MPQALKICLITAAWYGALSLLLIYAVAPWLHTGARYAFQDNMTIEKYQSRAVPSAALGYVLLCAVLIWSDANRRKASANAPLSR